MKILTTIQEEFIRQFVKTSLNESFYLTGGTTLSAFYLQHRISEDLDFFTEIEGEVPKVLPLIEEVTIALNGQLEIKRNFKSFIEFNIARGEEILRCDFAMDSPFRLEKKCFKEDYGIYIDNILDISCNKLSALYDRSDPKDFIDIYFIAQEIIPFEKLIEDAKKKHIGLDNYWLAVSMKKVEKFVLLPRLVKPVTLDDLKIFFRKKAAWLMER